MARIYTRKKRLTIKQATERTNRYQVHRQFVWIDPYPQVLGTKPEKMVYAELMRRGVPFQFQDYINTNIPDLEINQWFRPDFVLPAFRIVIEVQGVYFHTQPAAIEADATKFALYEMAGWKVLAWWDYDIESRLQDLFSTVAELNVYGTPNTQPVFPHHKQIDDLKGLRKTNSRRAKPWTHKPVAIKGGLF